MKIGIIGSGIIGMMSGYYLSRMGHDITIFEGKDHLGGLASTFEPKNNVFLETYHHFFSKNDAYLLELLEDLDLKKEIIWKNTKLGTLRNKILYPFTSILDLYRFPHLDFIEKLRFLYSMFKLHRGNNWEKLDKLSAKEWIIRNSGLRVYETLWQHLFESRFDGFVHTIPTAWFWARTKRRAKSRSIFGTSEKFGYFKQSIKILFDSIETAIKKNGGSIITSSPVDRINILNSKVKSVLISGKVTSFDCILCTIPIPQIKLIAPELIELLPEKIRQIEYAGILNIILELNRPFSDYFWINVCDTKFPFPGIIEFTQLRPPKELNDNHFVYIPNYLPKNHSLLKATKSAIVDTYMPFLSMINRNFSRDDIIRSYAFKEDYADPYYFLNYSLALPTFTTPIQGLFLANTTQIYPWTRSINNGIFYAKQAADIISR
ncbi:MAG: FAD-dependent oxidoreductase [bacterium]